MNTLVHKLLVGHVSLHAPQLHVVMYLLLRRKAYHPQSHDMHVDCMSYVSSTTVTCMQVIVLCIDTWRACAPWCLPAGPEIGNVRRGVWRPQL